MDGVRLDRDEIGGDDGHGVADYGDGKGVVGGGVDETETVALSRAEGDLGVVACAVAVGIDVGAVEEDVVAWWG